MKLKILQILEFIFWILFIISTPLFAISIGLNELYEYFSNKTYQIKYVEKLKVAQWDCYEIWRPNIPTNGCSKQCNECREKQKQS